MWSLQATDQNRDMLQSDQPLDSYADLTILLTPTKIFKRFTNLVDTNNLFLARSKMAMKLPALPNIGGPWHLTPKPDRAADTEFKAIRYIFSFAFSVRKLNFYNVKLNKFCKLNSCM